MAAPSVKLDPDSLVARIIEELRANPDAQTLLLRALLTDEFLGMPVRLERVEAAVSDLRVDTIELKSRVEELNATTARLESNVEELNATTTGLKSDVASLKGLALEVRMPKMVRSRLSQELGLRHARMMTTLLQEMAPELAKPVEDALDSGVISDEQEVRINATDVILRAQRKTDRSLVWVAVEASNTIDRNDIERVRQSANALGAVFQQDALAAVIGYRIHTRDQERADRAGVHTIIVPEGS